MIRIVIAAVSPLIIIYLGTAFACWDVNPGNWSVEARSSTAVFGIIISFFAGLIAFLHGHSDRS